jgi:hypothetical protein
MLSVTPHLDFLLCCLNYLFRSQVSLKPSTGDIVASVFPSKPLYGRVRKILAFYLVLEAPNLFCTVEGNAELHNDSLGPHYKRHIEEAIAAAVSALNLYVNSRNHH